MTMNDSRPPNPRWYHLTPARLLTGLLVVEGFLLLSEQFCWFPFNEKKGWTVLIGVATICLGVLLLLFWFALSLLFRIRFQFSIRSLLVLVLAMAIGCSWLAVKMQEARRQKEVAEAIYKTSGWVSYDYGDDLEVWVGRKKPEPPVPAWLLELLGHDFFCDVSALLLRGELSDQVFGHLEPIRELQQS